MKTLVINFYGAPGSGKSTMASYIFSKLKMQGEDVEIVGEFAKELVWEERNETMKDEIYIFGKQHHRFYRLNGKVDLVVTDRPIKLSKFYNKKYGKESKAFDTLIDECVDEFENYNIFLKKDDIEFKEKGRKQTKEESIAFEKEMIEMFNEDIDLIVNSKQEKLVLEHITDMLSISKL